MGSTNHANRRRHGHVLPRFKRGEGVVVGVGEADDVGGGRVVLGTNGQPTVEGKLGERREKGRIDVGRKGRRSQFVLEPSGLRCAREVQGIVVISGTAHQKIVVVGRVEVEAVGGLACELTLGVLHFSHQPKPRVWKLCLRQHGLEGENHPKHGGGQARGNVQSHEIAIFPKGSVRTRWLRRPTFGKVARESQENEKAPPKGGASFQVSLLQVREGVTSQIQRSHPASRP